jgi:phage recombination protein Bet
MSNLAVVKVPSLDMAESELIAVMQNSVYPGAELPSIKLVLGWCKAQNKDPLRKPVHIVPMQVKQKIKNKDGQPTNKTETVWRDVLMPGIGDYRTDAARTGEYAGIGEAKFGPTIEETLGGEPKKEWDDNARAKVDTGKKYDTLAFSYPEWCEISVFRLVQGMRCEFSSGKVYFKEIYATAGADTSLPNAMWRKRPRGQLEKCAEAMALRRAFPEVGAQPTADELEGKVLEASTVIDNETGEIVTKPQVEQPSAKPLAGGAKQGASTTADNGDKPEVDVTPVSEGALKNLKGKMEDAALSEINLKAKFGFGFEGITKGNFAAVQAWIKSPVE